jgi:Mrp family chromosome partitioning ATPase
LLVAKHQSTTREAGRLARQYLSQVNARMLGMVLNQLGTSDLRRHDMYSQKYYDKYYAVTPADAAELKQDHHPSVPLN